MLGFLHHLASALIKPFVWAINYFRTQPDLPTTDRRCHLAPELVPTCPLKAKLPPPKRPHCHEVCTRLGPDPTLRHWGAGAVPISTLSPTPATTTTTTTTTLKASRDFRSTAVETGIDFIPIVAKLAEPPVLTLEEKLAADPFMRVHSYDEVRGNVPAVPVPTIKIMAVKTMYFENFYDMDQTMLHLTCFSKSLNRDVVMSIPRTIHV